MDRGPRESMCERESVGGGDPKLGEGGKEGNRENGTGRKTSPAQHSKLTDADGKRDRTSSCIRNSRSTRHAHDSSRHEDGSADRKQQTTRCELWKQRTSARRCGGGMACAGTRCHTQRLESIFRPGPTFGTNISARYLARPRREVGVAPRFSLSG
eukprot:474486-Rhodomonas_salina.2